MTIRLTIDNQLYNGKPRVKKYLCEIDEAVEVPDQEADQLPMAHVFERAVNILDNLKRSFCSERCLECGELEDDCDCEPCDRCGDNVKESRMLDEHDELLCDSCRQVDDRQHHRLLTSEVIGVAS